MPGVPGSTRPNAEQGYQLLARVIADYTGIEPFDAGAVLTFTGMSRLTDALGGVTLRIDQRVVSQHRRPDGSCARCGPAAAGTSARRPRTCRAPGS